MKKLLLLLALVLNCTFIYSQDFTRFRSMTKEEAKDFATEITDSVRESLMLWKEKENDRKITFIYIPTATDTVAMNKTMKKGTHLDVVFSYIDFEIIYEGKNLDLEIAGTKKYRFFQATFKLIDLLPIWQRYFNPSATLTEISTNYKMKEARYRENGVDWLYKFNPSGSPYWTLRRFY